MANEIIRPVQSLLKEHFYVPKYQRGYRWKKKQVEDLLNDIDRFYPCNEEGKNSWYCLQPLVVKVDKKCRLIVIDGQQRLTTIKLILHYLNNRLVKDEREDIFSVEYETRGSDEDWLRIIDNKEEAEKNIDFSHIYNSYQTIKEWFKQKRETKKFDFNDYHSKLSFHCKFIWYDIDQNGQNKDSEETVFIRLNDGKISLTNSELIKALFLNSSNFVKDKNEDEIRMRQLEISTQWDIIEQELSDDEFWYFINGKENPVNPRIEYLFDIIAGKPDDNKDKDFTFRHFQSKFEKNEQEKGDKIEFVSKQWESILNTYLILKEWNKDRNYYHLVGYLLCRKYLHNDNHLQTISELLHEYQGVEKDIFNKSLDTKIGKSLNWSGDKVTFKNNLLVSKILLLHNIVTMQRQHKMSRFSFSHYIGTRKEKGWDIEHIHARAEKLPEKEDHRKDWANEIKDTIKENDDLKDKIDNFLDWSNKESFEKLFEEVNQYFEDKSEFDEDNLDDLSNLALLDAGTNRGYGNEYYPFKRKTILEKDKNGIFIPMCTKKVFLKYYTKESPNMTFWGKEDRKEYLKDINEKLSGYFTEKQ